MASRRNLKKNVNYISDLIAGLCIVESMNAKDENREELSKLFLQAVNLRQDIISRISHTEPGNVKGFYKKLKEDFNNGTQTIFKNWKNWVNKEHETSHLQLYLPQDTGMES